MPRPRKALIAGSWLVAVFAGFGLWCLLNDLDESGWKPLAGLVSFAIAALGAGIISGWIRNGGVRWGPAMWGNALGAWLLGYVFGFLGCLAVMWVSLDREGFDPFAILDASSDAFAAANDLTVLGLSGVIAVTLRAWGILTVGAVALTFFGTWIGFWFAARQRLSPDAWRTDSLRWVDGGWQGPAREKAGHRQDADQASPAPAKNSHRRESADSSPSTLAS